MSHDRAISDHYTHGNLLESIQTAISAIGKSPANVTIEDFNDYFASEIADDEFDTIGGVVLKAFGHAPDRGEKVDIEGLHFEVLNADSRRMRLLRVNTPG